MFGGDGVDGCGRRLGEGSGEALFSEWHEEPQSRVYDRPRSHVGASFVFMEEFRSTRRNVCKVGVRFGKVIFVWLFPK